MEAVVTIGVYGWDEARFLTALRSERVDEVWDVRDRRGVRGRDGAWANATHLEEALHRADIGYRHRRELAPPTDLRKRLQEDDRDHRRRHRDRTELPSWFVDAYRARVLHELDLTMLATETTARRPALLCVEGPPSACHRSLAASGLADAAGVEVESLIP